MKIPTFLFGKVSFFGLALLLFSFYAPAQTILRDDFDRTEVGPNWISNSDWSFELGKIVNRTTGFGMPAFQTVQFFPQEEYVIETAARPFFNNFKRAYSLVFAKPDPAQEFGYAIRFDNGIIGPPVLSIARVEGNIFFPETLASTQLVLDEDIWYRFKIVRTADGLIQVFIDEGEGYDQEPILEATDTTYNALGHFGWRVDTESAESDFFVDWIEARGFEPTSEAFRDDFNREDFGDIWSESLGSDWSVENGNAFNEGYNFIRNTAPSALTSYEVESSIFPLINSFKRNYFFQFGLTSTNEDEDDGYLLRYDMRSFGTPVLSLNRLDEENSNIFFPLVLADTALVLAQDQWFRFKVRRYNNGLIQVFIDGGEGYGEEPILEAIDHTYPALGLISWGIFTETAPDPFYIDWIAAREVDAPAVESLVLVNAETDEDITVIEDGAKINLGLLGVAPNTPLSIRAQTIPGQTGSVRMRLEGPISAERTENLVPYALFGDNPGQDYEGQSFPPGDYRIQAIPFSEKNGQGTQGGELDFNFNLAPAPVRITQLVLVETDTNTDVLTLEDGIATNPDGKPLTIRADLETAEGVQVDRVELKLNGPLSQMQTERRAPYALFGDNGSTDYEGRFFCRGAYEVEAIPYANGLVGTALKINFDMLGSQGFSRLTLVDANTDQNVRVLVSSDTILASEINQGISLQIETSACTDSVRFTLRDRCSINNEGQTFLDRVERVAPFAIVGDDPEGDFHPWTPEPGTYCLRTVVYSNGGGLVRSYLLTIEGESSATESSAQVNLYPNPTVEDDLTVELISLQATDIQLLNQFGESIYQVTPQADVEEVIISTRGWRSGLYYLKVQTATGELITKTFIKP